MKKRFTLRLILAAFAVLSTPAHADDDLDFHKLIQEAQKGSEDPTKMTLVWWMPEIFWRASYSLGPMPPEQLDQMLAVLRPYLIVAVVDADAGPFGGANFRSEEEVRSEVRLMDRHGATYIPFSIDEVSADARNLIQGMRPILANLLGAMGDRVETRRPGPPSD